MNTGVKGAGRQHSSFFYGTGVCRHALTYADVCRHALTYALIQVFKVLGDNILLSFTDPNERTDGHAHVLLADQIGHLTLLLSCCFTAALLLLY